MDVDTTVVFWHHLFAPDVTVRNGNIIPPTRLIASPEFFSDSALYMNFCGVGQYAEGVLNALKKLEKKGVLTFISFDTSHRGSEHRVHLLEYLVEKGSHVSNRGSYRTFAVQEIQKKSRSLR